ncbi:MAG: putative Ig domain-containing protein [Chromatiaceae bacterium]|nr:putative Ig domain-containing protein [Chromatiaceae bacterium]
MYETLSDALDALSNLTSTGDLLKSDLMNIIGQVSVQAEGAVTVLYSGGVAGGPGSSEIIENMLENDLDIRVVDESAAAKLIETDSFRRKVAEAFGIDFEVFDTDGYRGPATDWLGHATEGPWADVSRRFAEASVGDVRIIAPEGVTTRILAQTELPALLDNPSVTSIDGVPKIQLIEYASQHGDEALRRLIFDHSHIKIYLSGLASGDLSRYLDFPSPDQWGELLKDPVKFNVSRDVIEVLERDAFLDEFNATMKQAAEVGDDMVRRGLLLPALNKLGPLGSIATLLVASHSAAAAVEQGDDERAKAIMEDWAVDAAGSAAGEALGAAVGGIAVGLLAAAGVVSAPVAAVVVFGAAIAGGFLGADAAKDLYGSLIGEDEADRREILRRLDELYFGEGGPLTTDTIPEQDVNFLWIDELTKLGTSDEVPPESFANTAKVNLAFRYALVKLNPFIVLQSESFYDQMHNANGELDRFDVASGKGLTDEYLLARAEALFAFVQMFKAGEKLTGGNVYPGGYDIHFLDAQMHTEAGADGAILDLHYTSDYKDQRLFGAAGDDELHGSTGADMLFGGDGDDLLEGNANGDYLEGGRGKDTYRAGAGDTIFDQDGDGYIFYDGALLFGGERIAGETGYVDASGAFRYIWNGQDLNVTRVSDNAILRIEEFENFDFNIALTELPTVPDPFRPLVSGTVNSEHIEGQHEVASGSTDWDALNTYNKPDQIFGGDGRDWIYAWSRPDLDDDGNYLGSAPDNDIVEGGVGKDFIHGGAGDDILYATTELDSAAVKNGFGDLVFGGLLGEEGDFVSAESGDDMVFGSGRLDGLFGGEGNDYLYAGGGNDFIYGDWQAYLPYENLAITDYDYEWITIDDDGNVTTFVDYVSGIGDDHIYAGSGNDNAWGEAGNDIIFGGEGNDRLNGDIARINPDGSPTLPPSFHGTDRLYGEGGEDTLIGNGGSDYLFGGDDNDWIEGDHRVVLPGDLPYHGDDQLFGENGADTLIGLGGNDSLDGGAGNDVLYGDLGDLDAAFHGVDVLHGGDGSDTLVGNGGNDQLFGGAGADHYEFSPGDGLDTIVDSDGGGQGDTLHFVGVGGIGSVVFTLLDGDLSAKVGQDGFVFRDWDVGEFGGVHYYDADGVQIGSQSTADVAVIANFAPTVDSESSSAQVFEDRLLNLSLAPVNFADANGGTLNFSASLSDGGRLPEWLSFNPDSLRLTGVPDNDAVGDYSIRVTADDGYGGAASHTVNLRVDNTNDAPELIAPLPSRSVTSGLDFEHDLSDYFRDVDVGDTLSVTVSLGSGEPLPDWASFDPDTLTLTGTAPNGFSDVLTIRAVASDSAGAETATLYTLSFHPATDSLQSSLLTRYDLSVPDSAGYYPVYADRAFFESQNGLLGDVNGDGYDDYYFGTDTVGHVFWRDRLTEWDGTAIPDSTAVVQIIYGDANGWNEPALRTTSFILGSDSIFDELGASGQGAEKVLLDAYRLTPLGDPNNDGFDDFALGDRVFWGNRQGFGETYRWEELGLQPLLIPADLPDFSSDVLSFLATIDGVRRTLQAKNVGDVNGDGLDDYVTPVDVSTYGSPVNTPSAVAGAPQQKPLDDYQIDSANPVEHMHVLYGQADGLADEIDLDHLDASQGYSIGGFTQLVETREHFGTTYDVNRVSYNPLVSGGDIDGDGLNDIAISTVAGFVNSEPVGVYHNDYSVRNYFLFGTRDPVSAVDLATMSQERGMTQEYLPNTTTYGQVLVPGLIELGGDINGDGFADAISVTGDYREADYGGRVDLRALYGSDLRNNALFQGGDESDDVVVKKQGSVYTLGGNDTVLICPDAGPTRYDVYSGSGDDTIDLSIPDNNGQGGGTTAYLNGGGGSDIYRVTAGSALPASGIRLPANNLYINDRSTHDPAAGSNSLVVGLGSSAGGVMSLPQLGFGSLKLSFAELDLAIHLQNFDKDNVLEGPRDIDTFDFGSGRIFTYEELMARGFDLTGTDVADHIEGSSVSDRIQGMAGTDTMAGGRGDDELTGGAGDDMLDGGEGDDRYFFDLGDGNDQISDPDGMDQIEFGEGLASASLMVDRTADDLALSFDSQDTLVLKDWFGGNPLFLERFTFFDGTTLLAADIEQRLTAPGDVLVGSRRGDDLTGTLGNDEIYGGRGRDTLSGLDGDDLIVGGRGRDLLLGGPGDDTFMVSPGDGYDDIWGGDGHDRIVGGAGDDTIGLHRHFTGDNGIEEIDGSDGYNVIRGSSASNLLDFSATELRGIAQIQGANGSDTIVGTSGDDVIAGGRGRDKLYGGAGNDTYLFSRTHGSDGIQDSGGSNDVLSLLDINHDQAWFSRVGDSLDVSIIGTRDSIRINDWFTDADCRIEQVQTADNMFVTSSSIDLLVSVMAAFDPSQNGLSAGSAQAGMPFQAEIAAAWQSSSGAESSNGI